MFLFVACFVAAYLAGVLPSAFLIYVMTVNQGDAPPNNWLSPLLFGLQWPVLVPLVFIRFRKFLKLRDFAGAHMVQLLELAHSGSVGEDRVSDGARH